MITEKELNGLYEELNDPNAWHWKLKAGWFAGTAKPRQAIARHLSAVMRELEETGTPQANAELERMMVYLEALRIAHQHDPSWQEALEAISIVACGNVDERTYRKRNMQLRWAFGRTLFSWHLEEFLIKNWDLTVQLIRDPDAAFFLKKFFTKEDINDTPLPMTRAWLRAVATMYEKIRSTSTVDRWHPIQCMVHEVSARIDANAVISLTKAMKHPTDTWVAISYNTALFALDTEKFTEIVDKFFATLSSGEWELTLFFHQLPKHVTSLTDLENIIKDVELLKVFAARIYAKELSEFIEGLSKTARDVDHWNREVEVAKEYLSILGGTKYTWKVVSENAGHLCGGSIQRFSFSKTGSELIPLGGALLGYLIRIIPRQAYEAWKRAFEARIPTEEILKREDGRYRVKVRNDGRVSVMTKYAGERLDHYLYSHPQSTDEVIMQQRQINQRLQEIGVEHRHAEDRNFVVDDTSGKPIVRIIDFDMAESSEEVRS